MGTGVKLGAQSFSVEQGAAAAQWVEWRPDLWSGVAETRGGRALLDAMNDRYPDGQITRSSLWSLAAGADEDTVALAHLATMAWGLGTNVRRGRAPTLRALAAGTSVRLLRARDAAPAGLVALWDAHFRGRDRPPLYLGQVAFGTKWLHVAGWSELSGSDTTAPLIFDQFVHHTVTRCLGVPLAYPSSPTAARREAWVNWCEMADAAGRNSGVSSADVEVTVFRHSRDDRCPRALGDDVPCLWASVSD